MKAVAGSDAMATHRRFAVPWLYLLPFVVGLAIFTAFPVINIFAIAMREDYRLLTGVHKGFGFGNFTRIFQDRYFINSLRNTGLYVGVVVPVSTLLSLLFAHLLNQRLRFSALFQTVFFLPMVTSVVAVGLAWKWMFNYDYGLFNFLLGKLGVDPINWLNNPAWNLWALIIYGIWSNLPFAIIILLAGLQNIDPIYAKAAAVDGASRRRIFMRITLPLLAPTISLVVVINTISASKVFAEMFPLWNGKPGVAYNLYTVVFYIYELFYVKWRLGDAGAAAVVLLAIVVLFTLVQRFIQRAWADRT